MDERKQDQALIAKLSEGDRAEFEALVEGFVQRELGAATPAALRSAADGFDHVCRNKPCSDGATGLLFAAFLRERAAVLAA